MSATEPFRILFVEDVPSDTQLAVHLLQRSGLDFSWSRVDRPTALSDALAASRPDVVVSDFHLPGFTGLDVLTAVRAVDSSIPVIVLTGALSDETAVACLKAGAADYVLKEKPARLPFAVREVLDKARALAEIDRVQQALLKSEAALAGAQKMEAVARLAGGVSHDFNNLLTGVLGYCDLLLAAVPASAPYRSDVVQIQSIAHRAAALTRQLLAFGRRQPMSPTPLNLTNVVGDMKKPLRTMVRSTIHIAWDLAATLDDVVADPGQIEQAVYNLVTNACDAMPGSGTLTIRTAAVTLDAAFAASHPGSKAGRHVALSIADTGTGINPDALPMIFEPFFTTKGPGEGTGLGLAAVYGIVKQSNGFVSAESEPGRGSTFTMYFPVATEPVEQAAPAAAPAAPAAAPSETVLFVEDDESLRVVLRRVLEGRGYRTLEAVDGQHAIDTFLGRVGEIDLLLTDMVMPGRNGAEVARAFREARPSLPILFMSAYTDPGILQGIVIDDATSLIRKPYLPSTLARQIREMLDRHAAARRPATV